MTLIAGADLDPKKYFQPGSNPRVRGSTCDLHVGQIFDDEGGEVKGPFALKPGHIVQVVSKEIFKLPLDVTGHATYRTTLTKNGIFALTVGIVDPGWDGPLTTTLLNFSKREYPILPGMEFLRVTLFEHVVIDHNHVRPCPSVDEYIMDARANAATTFAKTFFNHDKVVEDASKTLLEEIQRRGFAWVGLIALIFTIVSFVSAGIQLGFAEWSKAPQAGTSNDALKAEITALEHRVDQFGLPGNSQPLSKESKSVQRPKIEPQGGKPQN